MDVSQSAFLSMTAAAAATVLALFAEESIAQTSPPNLPMAIICYAEIDESWRVGYLQKIEKSGDARYISADGRLGSIVSADGLVLPPTDRGAGLDCYGKTLDELRSTKRTMVFQHAR